MSLASTFYQILQENKQATRGQLIDFFVVAFLRHDTFRKAVKVSGSTADSGGAFAVLVGGNRMT